MLSYKKYCEDLTKFNQPITMTEAEFLVKYANVEEEVPRKFYTPTIAEFVKPKPKLPKKPSSISASPDYKAKQSKKHRDTLVAQGLTTRGTIPCAVRARYGLTEAELATRDTKAKYMRAYRLRRKNASS